MALAFDEDARLAALHELAILDTAPEQVYDDVVRLAAAICQTPIAVVNFVDADRQWGKAVLGLATSDAPRQESICSSTIAQDDGTMVISDMLGDPTWAEHPLVTGDVGARFYAGASIMSEEGHRLGAVCVLDTGARQLSDEQLAALRALARLASGHLELRAQAIRLARANEELRHRSVRDGLTGLANRAFLEETLTLSLHQRRAGRPGILFCDMDEFKQINDRLGHHAGDTLLQAVAARLESAAREGDIVARFAGDEFVVLCPGVERLADLDAIAERVTECVGEPLRLEGETVRPRLSVGRALAEPGEPADVLLRRADQAMYLRKSARRRVATAVNAG